MEVINGVVKSVRYTNQKNGYTVCDLKTEQSLITLVGIMPLLSAGENISATGDYVEHSEYGKQFKVEICERRVPDKEDGILEYLSSGFIKGLGPSTAKKIVETFKEDTFKIFQTEPYRLAEIKGINADKALSFGHAFMEHENMRGIVVLMQRYGVPANYASKVWKKFGSQAEKEIQSNPYRLSDNDIGLSFSSCDKIAFSLGLEPHAKERLKCALLFLLSSAILNGHTYLPKDELIKHAIKLTKINEELVSDAFDSLNLEGSICIEKKYPDRVYTHTLIDAERYCSYKLNTLNKTHNMSSFKDMDRLIEGYQSEHNIFLDGIQIDAVKCGLSHGVCVITGGPGTGKTTIIKSIIHILENKGLSFILAAPTGRAAKRISETSGYEAKTIHRLLEVGYSIDEEEKPYFMRNEDNPLSAEVIIVDEASMIDIILLSALLRAFPDGASLILVGDDDQLPSVGPGKVLSDIIQCGKFPVVKLQTIFRQSEESIIITNAHLINQGQIPAINQEEGDFYFIQRLKSQDLISTVVSLCTKKIPEQFGFDPFKDIQVLSPMRKGEAGVYNLNKILQQAMNPDAENKPQKIVGETIFRLGDRIMQIRNDYSLPWVLSDGKVGYNEGLGVYNGDMGIIIDIDHKSELLTVKFDDCRTCEYRFDKLDNLEHAYAVTVHKSQGTEFPVVVIPLLGVPSALICRNLLYTAVTRAKKLVVLVGSPAIMEKMIQNMNERDRYTGLKERLSEHGSVS